MKRLSLLFCLILLSACGKSIDEPKTPIEQDPDKVDISQLSLEDGLQAKYQELDFRCLSRWESFINQPDGFSKVEYQETEKVLWNILEDFQETKSIRLEDQVDEFFIDVRWQLELGRFDDDNFEHIHNGKNYFYEIANGTRLRGERSHLFRAVDKDGNLMFTSESYFNPSHLVESLTESEVDFRTRFPGLDTFQLGYSLDCHIHAVIKPEYRDQFRRKDQ